MDVGKVTKLSYQVCGGGSDTHVVVRQRGTTEGSCGHGRQLMWGCMW